MCLSGKVFKSPLRVVIGSPDMGSVHPPSPRWGKDGTVVQGMQIPRPGHPGERAELLRRRSGEMGREQKPRNASMLPGW